jgi:hypothetical protein
MEDWGVKDEHRICFVAKYLGRKHLVNYVCKEAYVLMSLSCEFNQFTHPKFFEDRSRQITVDAQLYLSENLPEIDQIKGGNFRIDPVEFRIADETITISGRVYPYVIYLAKKEQIPEYINQADGEFEEYPIPQEYAMYWNQDLGIDFEETISIPGLNSEMLVEVESKAITGNFEKITGNEVVFQGKIELTVHSVASQSLEVLQQLQPAGKVNCQKEQITVEESWINKSNYIPIRSSLVLPNLKPGISRILEYQVKPANLSAKLSNDKVSLQGVLEVTVVYVGSDESGRPTEIFVNEWSTETGNAIPFETMIEYQNHSERTVLLPKVTAKGLNLSLRNQRELVLSAELKSDVAIIQIGTQEVITEVIPEAEQVVDVEKNTLTYNEFTGEQTTEIEFEAELSLAAGQPDLERILLYGVTPLDLKFEAASDKVLVEGGLDVWLRYIADNSGSERLATASWEERNTNSVPITAVIDFPGIQPETLLQAQVILNQTKLEMSSERSLKLSGTLKTTLVGTTPRSLTVLSNCALVERVDPGTRPCMLFYVVQPEDTLWKIARHYQTTVETLVKANKLVDSGQLTVGQKLLIPKKIAI